MKSYHEHIIINLDAVEQGLKLTIYSTSKERLVKDTNAKEFHEASIQIYEGNYYDYGFNKSGYHLKCVAQNNSGIIKPNRASLKIGRLEPNIYVGTLGLEIWNEFSKRENLDIEVRSLKTSYREDYRTMMEEITTHCTDLILRSDSPVAQTLDIDFDKDSKTLYQRFAFVKSLIENQDFEDAIYRITSSPNTKWSHIEEQTDVRSLKRIQGKQIKQLIQGNQRSSINHSYLNSRKVTSINTRIWNDRRVESKDTPENRFVKHVLIQFQHFIFEIKSAAKASDQLKKEAFVLNEKLEVFLEDDLFKEVGNATSLSLNSPLLQRKEGYRQLLRAWLLFDLAGKLIWQGGEEVYKAGKKDIATLYEYWLFFKLLEILKEHFEIEPKDLSDLIKPTENGLEVQLVQGKVTALQGVYNSGIRHLKIQFNYNKTFSGYKDYPNAGSYTTQMRPDYTLSIWPASIKKESDAELKDEIVHIHFDAKYKVANMNYIQEADDNIDDENDLKEEKEEQKKGNYKRADLLKMHAYKDAIRRTAGAYVLYPGDSARTRNGFHEVLPGLGAFPMRPNASDDGSRELKSFLKSVIYHFENRANQYENIQSKRYDVLSETRNTVQEPMPESFNDKKLIPDDTFVMVGFYKSQEHLGWISKNELYNFRTSKGKGQQPISNELVNSKYILLHGKGDDSSSILYEVAPWKNKESNQFGPKIYSKQQLIKREYPTVPSQDFYLILKLKEISWEQLKGQKFNFKNLTNYETFRNSGLPFSSTLSELLNNKVTE